MIGKVREILSMPLGYHLVAAMFIRVTLIYYGALHDETYQVPYTDIDYRVFTDASRYIVNGESPYKRHTYRYSPLLAFLMIPNILVSIEFGKILFSMFDIFIGLIVKKIVEYQLKGRQNAALVASYCSFYWLYNPMSIAISSRGNADSVPSFFILASIYCLLTEAKPKGYLKLILSGMFLGISIHLRLYPIIFSFPMYLSLGNYNIGRQTGFKDGMLALIPNRDQIVLTISCVFTTLFLTLSMYALYGYEFLFETYIYHLFRKDTRHNFSVLFYYSYLTMDQLAFDIVKLITHISESIILFALSMTYGRDPKTLPFALFSQAVVLVTFNSVVTSQYFIWFLSLLPLVAYNFKLLPSRAVVLAVIWMCSQGAWLFYAYLLEFRSKEVFILIWLKGILFFAINIHTLTTLVKSYSHYYGFGFDLREIKTD